MDKKYFIHRSSFVDENVEIGDKTKIWHFSHVSSGAKIGKNCIIGQNVYISSNAVIGNNVKIQNNVSIYDNVIIKDDVFCGPSCVFTNVKNPRAFIERKNEFLSTEVQKGVSIGANATIICGIKLGKYCLVGAGSTVTKEVRPHELVFGSPAIFKGWVSHAGEILDDNLICPREKKKYYLVKNLLKLADK